MDESIGDFAAITGASPEVARDFLQLSSGDLERAVALYFENPDLVSGVGAGLPADPSSATTRRTAASNRSNVGRQDASGVIHIDSDDDDDDVDMSNIDDDLDDDEGFDDERVAAEQAANLAQEEEDAAMAKRLQEELYQGNGGGGSAGGVGMGEDDVRAPIARTTETLVAPDMAWAGDDGGMDSIILDQLRRRRQPPLRSGGPFSQTIWGDPSNPPSSTAENGSHARRLEDLFRPPYELMARLSWDEARTLGKEDKKWIMVNLQDMSDFNCQALNRDIWKDEAVRQLVSENFIFLQYDKDYPDAEEYITFYFTNRAHENPDNYPHVSIIDPRTGEQVKTWSGRPFPSASAFHSELAEFLDRYSLAANSKNPVAKTAPREQRPVDVDRMTEEEMLEMALKNSMAGGEEAGPSTSVTSMQDPDALTKSSELGTPQDKGKGPAADAPAEEEASAFSRISATNPHAEPENDPATTTRIQFRHPNGRVIHRFNLQDQVRRMFEWLKAEPLDGKEGVAFELKKMPQGQDLIDSLNETIEESGLKQGTVMIEFVED